MLTASDISIHFGDRTLFNSISVVIGERDKVGLVGRNGAGKSTLLKVIAGDVKADTGNIVRPTNSTLGFLHQEMKMPLGRTVMAETLTAFEHIRKMERRIEQINQELAVRTDYESDDYSKMLEEFADLNDRFALLGGITMEADAERVLKGLGFEQKDFGRLTDEFSGGWQMRIELAKMLLQRPDFLLLDEPTNHLDIESIIWLENWLKDYPGAVITISHDKQFLDTVTSRTVEVELGNLYDYKAPYTKYLELRADRREKTVAAYENQQKVIAQREKTINRFMAKATKTKMAQSMQKQLDKMERVEIAVENTQVMNLRFPPAPRSGQVVLEGKEITKNYDELRVLQGVDVKIDRGDRVSFVGQNGQGKTTLAKIMIGKIPATDGDVSVGHNVSVGYYAQNQSDSLDPNLTLLETMENHSPPEMRTKLRAILGAFLFSGEDIDKKVVVLSGGERARLALAAMLLRPFNLLVLDEPTNHLDIQSKDMLKQALMDYDGTLLVVSHDRDFLGGLTERTIEFRDHRLYEHLGDVNEFLEKRAMDSMRQVELEKSAQEKAAAAKAVAADPEDDMSYEERRTYQKAVQNAERRVESLENEIARLVKKMGQPGFYESVQADKILEEHRAKQEELEAAMEEWEKVAG
ncbi:MAG: ABC-F family ATP-binding cassette domain-containing protein [Saprospiraceae bacterium]